MATASEVASPRVEPAAEAGTVVETLTLTGPHSRHLSHGNQISADRQRTQSSAVRKERASSACAEGMMLPELQRSRWKTKTKTRGFFFPTVNCRWLGQCLMLSNLFLKGHKLQGGIFKALVGLIFFNNL